MQAPFMRVKTPCFAFPFDLQDAFIQPPPPWVPNHPPAHSHLAHKFKYPSFSPLLTNSKHSFAFFLSSFPPYDLDMASEPDDYQTISDNCPGYMVLVSEGIICTRCAGEKRHKANDCPKSATAAVVATESGSGADADIDWGMESLSDTSSVSSDSTGHSDGSEMQETSAHRFGQGGNHSQDAHPSRHHFARPHASYTSTQPDRTSPSPPNRQLGPGPSQATSEPEMQSRYVYDPKQSAPAEAYSIPRSPTTTSRRLSSSKADSINQHNDKKRKGSHSHGSTIYEPTQNRLPSKSLADTLRKFEYSNTTCPSSFGFGRLPSEAMG